MSPPSSRCYGQEIGTNAICNWRNAGCFAEGLHLSPGRLDLSKIELKKKASQRMLKRCIVMLGAFLGREMWGSRSLRWSLPKEVLWLTCLLIKAVCFLLLLCLDWRVWSLLSRLLELLSKFNLNLKIAVGLLKPHFSASLVLLKLHPAVLKYNPSSFSFGFSAEIVWLARARCQCCTRQHWREDDCII